MSEHDLRWSVAADEATRIADGWNGGAEPGGAIVLFDADRIRGEACGGLADLASGARFSAETVSRYASITKHVFASLVMAQDDGIGLDGSLGAHLGELGGPTAEVSVGRALDMTGGLPDVRETLSLLGVSLATISEAPAIMEFISRLPSVNFPAGSEISYSNTGYRLVEEALRRKSVTFQTHIGAINAALGVAFHAPEIWDEPVAGLAPGYWKSGEYWRLATSGLHLSASGCLTGSVRDLAIWLQTLLADRGRAKGALARLSAIRKLADGRPTDYGLGLARSRLGRHQLVGHGGSHAGYKAYFLLHPDLCAGVALVANREDVAPFPLALRVMAALLGERPPTAGTTLADGLYAAETGPFWLEIKGGVASLLGSGETLYPGEDGWSVSLSAHFPMRLRQDGEAITGEIGHCARRFRAVSPALADAKGLERAQGEWVRADYRASFAIENDRFVMGIGPTAQTAPLTALGGGRFITETADGPWPKRFCLVFDGDRVAVVTNRSRVLTFMRA